MPSLYPARDKEEMCKALENYLGDPVESYCPAQIDILSENFSVLLASESVSENVIIWHSEAPLSETWAEEERADFMEGYKQVHERNNGADEDMFADAPDSTCLRNGEEVTIWHGSRAFEQWFANNWEKTVSFQNFGDGVWVVSFSRIVSPF